MPLHWEREPETGVLIVQAIGKVAPNAYVDLWDELIADPHIEPGPRVLADFREVEVTQDGAGVRRLAAGAQRFDDFMRGGRMAVVATQQASFGLARMYASLVDALPIEVRVFRDYDEARAWVLTGQATTA